MQARKGQSHQVEALRTKEAGRSLGKGRGRRQAVSGGRSRGGDQRRAKKEEVRSRYSMVIQWSDEDQVYVVTLPEFGGCKTHGKTYEKAAKNGREVLEMLIESGAEDGESLPEPVKFGSP